MSTPLQKKWAAKKLDPDEIYNIDKDSITFIYDPRKDKLYTSPYPDTHGDLGEKVLSPEEQKEVKQKSAYGYVDRTPMLEVGYIQGRMGHVPWSKQQNQKSVEDEPDSFVIPVIAFWNKENFTEAQIKRTLQKLAEKYTDYFSSADEIIVTGEQGEGVPTSFLSDWGVKFGGDPSKKGEAPDCKAIEKIDIQGQPYQLQGILGALHAKRGEELGKLRGAFCNTYASKKQTAQVDCPVQSKMLDSLFSKFKCDDDDDWKKYLYGGKISYLPQIKQSFSPDEIEKQGFRTQSELDKAWDQFAGKKEHFSFREWLIENCTKEKGERNARSYRLFN